MITTVTTTTVATINSALAGSLSLIVSLTLISLLAKRELIWGLSAAWAVRLSRALRVVIVPLVCVFLITMAIRIAMILG